MGVSADGAAALKNFRDRYDLNFALAGDPGHAMLQGYGVWQEKSLYGKNFMGIIRTTFIIGPDGRIVKVFPKVKPDGHAAEVFDALKADLSA